MRVVVLLKQVPDIVSDRELGDDGRLVRNPADAVLSEVDEGALEVALRAGERLGASVTAVTMGPAEAAAVVRRALQVGANEAVHLVNEALAGSDARGTATALADAIRELDGEDPVGLVVAGMAALDGLGGVVPALVAAELSWPALSYADEVEVTADSVRVNRTTENAREALTAALPAVVSVSDTVGTLRAPNFQTMLAARSAPIRELTGSGGAMVRLLEWAPRPPRGEPVRVESDGARALVEFLDARGFLEVQA